MGLRTLGGFRERLSRDIGERGIGNPQLDSWIHDAYLHLVARKDFENLTRVATYDLTASSGTDILLPADLMSVIMVVDETSKHRLRHVSLQDYFSYDRAATGEPKLWTRDGEAFYFWPALTDTDGTHTIAAVYKIEPPMMADANADTVLDARWDGVISILAHAYALTSLAANELEMAKAALLMRTGEHMIESWIEDEAQDDHYGQMTNVAWDEGDLFDQEAS